MLCPTCGEENPERFRFCGYCGHRLEAAAQSPVDERKVVTVLFCDLVGFTSLSEALDAEDVAIIQEAYFSAVRHSIARHGGRLEKFIGDAAMAAFGVPVRRDDDAVRAVRAGLSLISAVEHLDSTYGVEHMPLRARVGINTGEVVFTEDRLDPDGWRVTGDVVNVASRLEISAPTGAVLIGEATNRAVTRFVTTRAAGSFSLKGKALPVNAWRVSAMLPDPAGDHAMNALTAPTLGRDRELARLHAALRRARISRSERWLIIAPPGVGKTRLAAEFVRRVCRSDGVRFTVLSARARPDVSGPFELVAQLLTSALTSATGGVLGQAERSISLAASRRILSRALHQSGVPAPRADLVVQESQALLSSARGQAVSVSTMEREARFAAWGQALVALAGETTAVTVVEDVHWAGPDFLSFLDFLSKHAMPVGALIIATARPAFLERSQNRWGTQGELSPRILHLQRLSPVRVFELIDSLVGNALPWDLMEQIADCADGNPLFVEELIRTLIGTNVLVKDNSGQFSLSLAADGIRLPSTVQAIYAGQLDDLPPAARLAARHASVAGKHFPLACLSALEIPDYKTGVQVLQRRGMLEAPHTAHEHAGTYTFRHALLRDAAYETLSRAHRAHLHLCMAGWLESEENGATAAEAIAMHYADALTAAPALKRSVDGYDRQTIAAKAASWFGRAAELSLQLSAHDAATNLFRQGYGMTPPDAYAERGRLSERLGESLRRSGELDEALASYERAATLAKWIGDAAALGRAALGYEDAVFHARRSRESIGDPSVRLLEEAESGLLGADTATRARVLAGLGRALAYSGHLEASTVKSRQAVELARRLGDPAALTFALLARRAGQVGADSLRNRLSDATEMVEASCRSDDMELMMEAERLRLIDLLEVGDIVSADRAIERMNELNQKLNEPLYLWYGAMWQAMRALFAGRVGEAEPLLDLFLAQGRRWRYRDVEQVYALQLLLLRRDQGRSSDVIAYIEEVAQLFPDRRSWACGLAVLYADVGLVAEARDQIDQLADQGYEAIPQDLAWVPMMSLLSEASAKIGHARAIQDLYPKLLPWSGHNAVLGSGAVCLGSVSRYLALLASAAERWDTAARHFEHALEMNESMHANAALARTRLELGQMLLSREREEERQHGSRLVTRAGQLARSIGLALPS